MRPLYLFLITVGDETFVTVTEPLVPDTMRIGTTSALELLVVEVEEVAPAPVRNWRVEVVGVVAVVAGLDTTADDVVGVTGVASVVVVVHPLFAATLGLGMAAEDIVGVSGVVLTTGVVAAVVLIGRLAATLGLGTSSDDIVGLRIVFVLPLAVAAADCVVVGPAANWPGVAVVAAVFGVICDAFVMMFDAVVVLPTVAAAVVAGVASVAFETMAPVSPPPITCADASYAFCVVLAGTTTASVCTPAGLTGPR
jgi:hypothetical protein